VWEEFGPGENSCCKAHDELTFPHTTPGSDDLAPPKQTRAPVGLYGSPGLTLISKLRRVVCGTRVPQVFSTKVK